MTKSVHALLFILALTLFAIGAAPTTRPKVVDHLMPLTHSSTRPTTATVDTIVLHFSSDLVSHPDHPYDVARQIQIYEGERLRPLPHRSRRNDLQARR